MINTGLEELDTLESPVRQQAPTTTTTLTPTIKWGDSKVQTGDGLNRVKASTERQVRFALIPNVDPQGQMTHFVSTPARKGYFVCPGNGCPVCTREDARWLGAALVVVYTNADANGKLPADEKPKYEAGFISLSAQHFQTLSEASEGHSPTDLDWIMSFDGRRYSFRAISSPPRYRKAGDEEAVKQLAAPLAGKIANKVGKRIGVADLKSMLSSAPQADFEMED